LRVKVPPAKAVLFMRTALTGARKVERTPSGTEALATNTVACAP
jgi:hypothetical protein